MANQKTKIRPAKSKAAMAAKISAGAKPAPLAVKPKILTLGEPAPFFVAKNDINPIFSFGGVAGRWAVVAIMGATSNPVVKAAHDLALSRRALFNDNDVSFFGVLARSDGSLKSGVGYYYFSDDDLAVSKAFGAVSDAGYTPMVYLLDRAFRVVRVEPITGMADLLTLAERMVAEEAASLATGTAPVMTIPRIFEPELCEVLIGYYQERGGEVSGFMRQIDGKTVLMHDDRHKRRRDVTVEDEQLRTAIRQRIERRLLPMIERSFGWKATQLERYLVACYTQADSGFFRPHRDNTTDGTIHRKFAVTINLNADFDGGELRFPEFGTKTYRPPLGGATVFNCGLLHEATPVTRGDRYAFLPFLYDDEGAAIRAANLDKVKID